MQVLKTTIKVQASFNYQISSMEAEIADYTEEEFESYKRYLVDTCSRSVKELSNAIGPTHSPTNTTPVQTRTTVQTQRVEPAKVAPVQQAPVQQAPVRTYPAANTQRTSQATRFASEKQIQYLHGLGYTGPTEGLTFADADIILKQLKGQL